MAMNDASAAVAGNAVGQRHELAPQSDSLVSISAELFCVPLGDDRHLIYAPLRRSAFVGNTRMVNFIASLQAGRAADLDADVVEFLRQLEIVDAGPEMQPVSNFSGDPSPVEVTLFLTTACNLRCTYCYASAGDKPSRFMPLEVAKRGIDFVAENAKRLQQAAFDVSFHGGGEPTVNWQTLTAAWRHAQSRAADLELAVHGAVATNGVLNAKQTRWIIENLDGASVSFDGLPSLHDRVRPTASGQGSSARVAHTLKCFDLAGFAYGLRMTVTQDQIAALPDSVAYVCENFRPQVIQIEPVYNLGRGRDAPSAETEAFVAAFRAARHRANLYGREIHFSAARIDTLTNHFCGVTQDSFCLSPDGNVSACYEAFSEDSPSARHFFYGKPAAEGRAYAFDTSRLDHLRGQAVQHREWCRGCFAKWHCAGDCYHKSVAATDSLEFRGSARCPITRELLKDQILERIERAGGLFWHEPDGDCDVHA